jgi:hypothetical protein
MTPSSLIAAGYTVVPVVHSTKRPAIPGWTSADYTSPDPEDYWPSGSLERYGVGIVCGRGLMVVDVDDWAAWKAVCALHGWDAEHPPGARGSARTPSGGRHFYFALPDGVEASNANTFPDGIDVRGAGGYVVAPPTPGYRWV